MNVKLPNQILTVFFSVVVIVVVVVVVVEVIFPFCLFQVQLTKKLGPKKDPE